MRDITHCPNCQTQFFVSEDQLKQHGGLVRCGQCLHVFNAKEQFVPTGKPTSVDTTSAKEATAETVTPTFTPANQAEQSSWPSIDTTFTAPIQNAPRPETEPESHAGQQPITSEIDSVLTSDQATSIMTHTGALAELPHEPSSIAEYTPNDTSKLNFSRHALQDASASEFNELAKHTKHGVKHKIINRWIWALAISLLVLTAVAQSAYFLRNSIASYYPNLKPLLLQACQHLGCRIELPKQIEWMIIDDSDMQEDLEHAGVMHLSSSLFNKASFVQAYPNLELTLTDTDDNPVLRRIFKPVEYLPPKTDISSGFGAGNEVKIKLAITTPDIVVAGYRLYINY